MCKKLFSCLFIILVLIFVFSASVSLMAADPVNLLLWIFIDPEGEDPRGMALKNIVTSFNESHPDIHVDVESIHYSRIDAQFIQAAQAGAGPDLINIFTDQLALHVAADVILPLNQYAEGWLEAKGTDYILPIEKFNNNIMSIPWETRVFNFWYREDALKKAGLEPPKTLEELLVIGGKLYEASGGSDIGFGLSFSEQSYGSQFFTYYFPILWAYGGQIFDENGEPDFTSDANVATMQWFKDAVNKYGVIGREGLTITADDVTNGVKAGNILMAIAGSHRISMVRSGEGIGDNLVTAPIPGITSDKYSPCNVAAQTLAISKTSKNPEAAWEFIEHFLSMESQIEFAKAGVMPVLASAYDNPIIMNDPMGAELKSWMEYIHEYGRWKPFNDDYNLVAELLVKASQKIVYQNAPIRETLEGILDYYNETKK